MNNFVNHCIKYVEFRLLNDKSKDNLHSTPTENLRFQILHFDHYGLFEKCDRGYKYILTVVNGCTNLIKLYLCKSMKSEKTIKNLKDYFRNYSKPRCTISNR